MAALNCCGCASIASFVALLVGFYSSHRSPHYHIIHCIIYYIALSIASHYPSHIISRRIRIARTGNYIKNWRPRWFQLRDGILCYYKEPTLELKPTNFFVLAGTQIRPYEKFGIGAFEMVMANGERRYMQANGRAERDEWIQCLCDAATRRPNTSPVHAVAHSSSRSGNADGNELASSMAMTSIGGPTTTPAAVSLSGNFARTHQMVAHVRAPSDAPLPPPPLPPGLSPPLLPADVPAGLSNVKLTPESFEFTKVLGKGNYGKVLCTCSGVVHNIS